MTTLYTQIFFARPPEEGLVKTRIAKMIGKKKACEVYTQILSFQLSQFKEEAQAELHIHTASIDKDSFFSTYANTNQIFHQKGKDLGEKMANAFWESHRKKSSNNTPLLLAGTDIPAYSPSLAKKITELLKEYEVVIGPSQDGGYYVIGLCEKIASDKKKLMEIFGEAKWSHPRVLQEQRQRLTNSHCQYYVLEENLMDIDTYKDLCLYAKGEKPISLDKYVKDIRLLMPVFNEAKNLEYLLPLLKEKQIFTEIVCADNGSTDGSVEIAKKFGAFVTHCKRRGYGATCLKSLESIEKRGGCDIVFFMDADGSDDLASLEKILEPVLSEKFDFSLGARDPNLSEKGALLPQARFGNWLATTFILLFWKFSYQDLGPLRCISWAALQRLKMDDKNFGWTLQMQVRAIEAKLRITEIKVPYRKRHSGKSKISGSIQGAIQAGYIILLTIFKELFKKTEKEP